MMRSHRLWRSQFAALALIVLLGCRDYHSTTDTPAHGRLISLSPAITEILYGVGALSSVVADSAYCDYPEAAKHLPHVGGFFDANLEAISALKPDLVILLEAQAPFFKEKLEQMGLRTLVVRIRSIADAVEAMRIIGRATGHHEEGDRLANEVRRRIDKRIAETARLPRLRVLCSVDHLPGTLKDVHAASGGSFFDELIAASGGQNVAPPDEHGYLKIQQEAIVDANPQVVIDIVHKPSAERAGDPLSVWTALPQVDAVRDGRVAIVGEPFVTHPSQRLIETLDLFSRIIHPEVFGPYGE